MATLYIVFEILLFKFISKGFLKLRLRKYYKYYLWPPYVYIKIQNINIVSK